MGIKKPPTYLLRHSGAELNFHRKDTTLHNHFKIMLKEILRDTQKTSERKRVMFVLSIPDAIKGDANPIDVIHATPSEALQAVEYTDGMYELYLTMQEARAAEKFYRNNH